MVDIPTKAVDSTVEFSDCNQFRYSLCRNFASGKGSINFIMLNPSTADLEHNDPTIHRCEQRAIAEGFGQMVITNIFAYRATEPKDMKAFYGKEPCREYEVNFEKIRGFAETSDKIIGAWGNHGSFLNTADKVREVLRPYQEKVFYLKLNKSGEPQHPLYVAAALKAQSWIF